MKGRKGLLFLCLTVVGVLLQTAVVAVAGAAEGVGRLSKEQVEAPGDEELSRSAAILELSEQYLRDLRKACIRSGFTAAEFSRLLTLMTRAKLAGLPHDPLLSKLEEGLAKGVMPERIQGALQDKARTLRAAKEVVDQLIMQGWVARDYTLAVSMVADALEAGAEPAHVLRAVRDNRPCREGIPDVRAGFERMGPRK